MSEAREAGKEEHPLRSRLANDRSASSPARQGAKYLALVGGLALSALAMNAALASVEGRWLGWVTLLPLFLAIRALVPWQALLAGSFWGLSLCVFSATSQVVDPSLRSFVLLTAIPGLYAFVASRVTRRVGFSPLLLGLGWVAVELALQPLALHRGLLAGTQGDGLVIRTLGNVAGYLLVAFLVAYVNATLLSILSDVCAQVDTSRQRVWRVPYVARWFLAEAPPLALLAVLPSQPRAPPAGR